MRARYNVFSYPVAWLRFCTRCHQPKNPWLGIFCPSARWCVEPLVWSLYPSGCQSHHRLVKGSLHDLQWSLIKNSISHKAWDQVDLTNIIRTLRAIDSQAYAWKVANDQASSTVLGTTDSVGAFCAGWVCGYFEAMRMPEHSSTKAISVKRRPPSKGLKTLFQKSLPRTSWNDRMRDSTMGSCGWVVVVVDSLSWL